MIGDHHHVVLEEGVHLAEQRLDGHRLVGRVEQAGMLGMLERRHLARQPGMGGQPGNEIGHADAVEGMVPDGDAVAGGIDGVAPVDVRRVDAEIHVGQLGAEQHQAIALLDIVAHRIAAHGALVDAEIGGVGFGEDRLAGDGGGDRHAGLVDDCRKLRLQAEAVQLLARQDHRPLGLRQVLDRFGDGDGQRLRRRPACSAGRWRVQRADFGDAPCLAGISI